MAEEELDGFENLDDLFGEEGGGEEAAAVSEGIDDLLGDDAGGDPDSDAGGGDPGDAAAGEGGDSELDSFFEDLSTIDDLEMTQEEPPPEAAAPAEEAAPVVAAPAAEPAPAKPKKEKKPSTGRMRKLILLLIFVGLPAGVFWFWDDIRPYIFPTDEAPQFQVVEPEPFVEEPVVEEPPPPPEPVRPAPTPSPPPPAAPGVSYRIQVATCFFSSCVQEFRTRLSRANLSSAVREKKQTREMLEIFTKTVFDDRDQAESLTARINREHRMEGQAYVFRESGGYRISMGTFTDLSRANVIKDALNQRLRGEAIFISRIKNFPYTLKFVYAGNFNSRRAALSARARLIRRDSRFSDSFLIRN